MGQLAGGRILRLQPVLGPLRVEGRRVSVHDQRFDTDLAVAIPQPLAVRTVHHVAAEIQTAERPQVDLVDAVEQVVGAREFAGRFEVRFDQQRLGVAGGGLGRQALDDDVAEAVVVELGAELFAGLSRRDELIDLVERLVS